MCFAVRDNAPQDCQLSRASSHSIKQPFHFYTNAHIRISPARGLQLSSSKGIFRPRTRACPCVTLFRESADSPSLRVFDFRCRCLTVFIHVVLIFWRLRFRFCFGEFLGTLEFISLFDNLNFIRLNFCTIQFQKFRVWRLICICEKFCFLNFITQILL